MNSINQIFLNKISRELDITIDSITPMTGDASSRRYSRLHTNHPEDSLILMELDEKESKLLRSNEYSWVKILEELALENIIVPKILFADKDSGSLVIEDFGDLDLSSLDNQNSRKNAYEKAIDLLIDFSKFTPSNNSCWAARSFDPHFFYKELLFFWDNFVVKLLGFESIDQEKFKTSAMAICKASCNQVFWFTHRDYHARNLMLFNNTLGLIDFQDARLGPASYDACSLCFDPYAKLSFKERCAFFDSFIDKVNKTHGESTAQSIITSWEVTAIQRLLKAIGSYSFLASSGKRQFLSSIAPALGLASAICKQSSDLGWVDSEWISPLKHQFHLMTERS